MSKISLVLILMLMAGRVSAQQDYFIFFQADNNQPFYILKGDKSYSSSAQGHLILSQLKEGVLTFKVGWPGKRWPEQTYTVSVKGDLEFQLKNLGEKGWQLFNPQTLELKAPDKAEVVAEGGASKEGVKKDDAFSRMMAGVVSDTAVMYNTYAMDKVLKEVPAGSDAATGGANAGMTGANAGTAGVTVGAAAGNVETAAANGGVHSGNGAVANGGTAPGSVNGGVPVTTGTAVEGTAAKVDMGVATKDSVVHKDPLSAKDDTAISVRGTAAVAMKAAGKVVKVSEKRGTKNWRGVYTDGVGKKADTIVVIIPNDTVARVVKSPARSLVDTAVVARAVDTAEKGGVNGVETAEKKGASVDVAEKKLPETAEKKMAADAGEKKATAEAGEKKVGTKLVVVNSDCKNFATDYDLDKLRVKMLEASKDDDRIVYARKVFKTKCFTTRQIRALSEVFVTDGQKYRFFETAYPFVSDDKFGELASLLADPVYNSKFKAMTGQ